MPRAGKRKRRVMQDDDEDEEQTQLMEDPPEDKPQQATVSWDDNTQVLDISPPRVEHQSGGN